MIQYLFVLEVNKHRTLCLAVATCGQSGGEVQKKGPTTTVLSLWILCVGMWCSELKSTNCHTLCLSNCQKLHTATNENISFSPEFAICVFLLLCFSFFANLVKCSQVLFKFLVKILIWFREFLG